MSRCPRVRFAAKIAVVTILIYPLGCLCHEAIGHGLTSILFGGRVVDLEMFGLRLYPKIEWTGWTGRYGECGFAGNVSEAGHCWIALGGALSTWLTSVAAMGVLVWNKRARRSSILAATGLWWFDMFTYTLPSWGLHRSIFWGQRDHSEPYEGAIGLGMPGWLFQGLVILTSAVLVVLWARLLFRKTADQARPA